MIRTVSITAEFDVDIRGEFTEKKMLKLMRDGGDRLKNPTFTEIAIDGVPNDAWVKMANKELLKD